MEGWIKLHRKIAAWEWYKDPNVSRLFIHLLLFAVYRPCRWAGTQLMPGQYVTTMARLSEETGMSPKSVRTSIDKLIKTGEITKEGTNQNTIITIVNYEAYQSDDEHYEENIKKWANEGQAESGYTSGTQETVIKKWANEGQTKGKRKANEGQTKGKHNNNINKYNNTKKYKNINNKKNSVYDEPSPIPHDTDTVPFDGGLYIYNKAFTPDANFEDEITKLSNSIYYMTNIKGLMERQMDRFIKNSLLRKPHVMKRLIEVGFMIPADN